MWCLSSPKIILFFLFFKINLLFRNVLHILNVLSFFVLNWYVNHLWRFLTLRCFRLDDWQLNVFTLHQTRCILHLLMSRKRLQIRVICVVHGWLQFMLGLLKHLGLWNSSIIIYNILIWFYLSAFRDLYLSKSHIW